MHTSTKLLLLMSRRTSYATAWDSTSGWTGAGLSVSGGNAIITPTQGSELFANGTFAAWTANNPNNWTVTGESGTDPEVSQVGTGQAHGGSGTGMANLYTTGVMVNIRQDVLAANVIYGASVTLDTVVAGALRWMDGTTATLGALMNAAGAGYMTYRPPSNTVLGLKRSGGLTNVTFDNASVKALTLSTLYAYRDMGTSTGSISAGMIRTDGTWVGLILYKDANNILALYLNGASNLVLDQLVAGTWSNIASVAATYSAGAALKLSIPGGNVASGIYNGTTLISGAAINAAFASATQWGIFSTYASNTIGALTWSATP